MPIATPAQYAAMLDAAQNGNYAYPAMNVTSLTTINGALKAFADKKSDGFKFAKLSDEAKARSVAIIENKYRLPENYGK